MTLPKEPEPMMGTPCRVCGEPFLMYYGGPSNCNRPDCGRDEDGEIEECYQVCRETESDGTKTTPMWIGGLN